jgi:hypothetical protein
MSNSKPKEATKKKPGVPKAGAVKPVMYKDVAEDAPEEKIDLTKAYDWTKKYSYDPEGLTYIRSMPTDDVIDPKDDPELNK